MPEVLACLDFADAAAPVLDTAAELAGALGGRLHLLHVAADEPELAGYDKDAIATFTREDRARQLLEEHHDLRARADELAAGGLEVVPVLIMGPTVDKVLEEADALDAAYIVVGSHGHGGLHNLLLGSVSDGLARKSHRPVVLVPVQRR
jgi:nucleotide-binding universal stress UspA family protein